MVRTFKEDTFFQAYPIYVGPNGIGKASFVNALFDQVIIPKRKPHLFCKEKDDLEAYVPITFTPYKVEREEYGRKVSIRVIDTVDFGESLNNTQG